ncbi:MAG: efflux RND transporter periplasmic adaptor subunit [Candidatus Binatia bacterium]|nr:efflux RND transporter periplasmic adaptor subunit [Candidatus Binatia bacterium]
MRVAKVEQVASASWSLSGTIRAREEAPLAFRVGGQIRRRWVEAGRRVAAGEMLFELDDHDARQGVAAAEAQVVAARAEAEHAERERVRAAALREQRLVSEQGYELAATTATAARERLRVAEAQLAQARNLLDYTKLAAPAAGIVAEVHAEVGQVVAPGQPVAVVALEGPREAEVYLPETRHADPPAEGVATVWGDPREWPARLREVAGSADPLTRTWRARFALQGDTRELPLGATVRLVFSEAEQTLQRIAASALFDNGDGAHVWIVRDGRVQLETVRVHSLEGEHALIENRLPADAQVVALGVHLLQPGQAVRIAP